ncbi:MAG: type III PLP-dependent enzyme [Deltaproteobacteria bacterium]|nr:type III PLP-dependent enzyme [Deltaproteobacteria bacterium]
MLRSFRIDKFHAEIIPKSTLLKVLTFIDRQGIQTPFLLMDTERIRENISIIGKSIKNSTVFYALKANPDPAIADFVNKEDVGFEIASEGELAMLSSLGVEPSRIISSNPVKPIRFLQKAAEYGVRYFAFDSLEELDKIARYAPGSNVYVRLSVPNEGSEWPLSRKFGLEIDDAVELLSRAEGKGIHPVGVTFHVGSQCQNPYNWNIAIDKAKLLWDKAESKGIRLTLLNIGGGYPINYTKVVTDIDTIERNIANLIGDRFPEDTAIHLEPGRAVIGDAGILVSSVIGKARRQDEDWLYIDVGVFNGLMESLGGIRYTYIVEAGEGSEKWWTIAGPSCDSFDVIDRYVTLPDPDIGALILILSSGAYTVSYASEFNGFSIPKTILI